MSVPPVVAPPVQEPVPLDRLPFPLFVRILAFVTIAAFVVALTRVPHALSVGLAAERGKRALAAGDAGKAESELRRVVKEYPKAEDARKDLVRSEIALSHFEEANHDLTWFDGKKVTKEEEAELQEIETAFENAMKRELTLPGAEGGE